MPQRRHGATIATSITAWAVVEDLTLPSKQDPHRPDRTLQDKPLEAGQAATLLGIALKDLPRLGRQWTRSDVRRLHRERPGWLLTARRRQVRAEALRAGERRSRLDAARGAIALEPADVPPVGAGGDAADGPEESGRTR